MAMDFPTSPNPGQTYTYAGITYTWNGYGWIGGALGSAAVIADAPADGNDYVRVNNTWRMVKQTIIPTVGALSVDIPIPSWAKMAELDLSIFCATGTNNLNLQVSSDGTTFVAGASDYNFGGPYHLNASPGTFGAATPTTNGTAFTICGTHDHPDVPVISKIHSNVVRAVTTQQFAFKIYSESYNAAQNYVTVWYHGSTGNLAGAPLRLAAYRITSTKTFLAGSQIQCRWL
jgi:hypothetical protein